MELEQKPALPFGEFVALMALMIALVALSIDTMLPALPEIGAVFGHGVRADFLRPIFR